MGHPFIGKTFLDTIEISQPNKTWRTSISEVKITGEGSLEFLLTRPNSGPATSGHILLFKNEITIEADPIVKQPAPGKESGKQVISSDKIDFEAHRYVLCYGPHYSDMRNLVAASVDLEFGIPQNRVSSSCFAGDHTPETVRSTYRYNSNPLGFGHWNGSIVVREGAELGEGTRVGRLPIPIGSGSKGTVTVDASIKRGHTYNVSANLYSDVRPVAGYSFTRAK